MDTHLVLMRVRNDLDKYDEVSGRFELNTDNTVTIQ